MNKTYFLGSNTAYGFFGDFSHLTRGKTVILKGGAGTGKSTLMKKVNEIALDAGFMTETYRCSSDVSSFDAVFVPSKNFAVIDGTSPHVTEAEIPLVSGFVFNLLDAADEKKIAPYIRHSVVRRRKCIKFIIVILHIAVCDKTFVARTVVPF